MTKKISSITLRIAAYYALFAVVWIILSDYLLSTLVTDHTLLSYVQTYKGLAFVAITAVLLYSTLHTQLKLYEKEKASKTQSEEQFRMLFENSGEAILLTHPDGRVYAANPAACRMFGRSEEEICCLGREGLVDTTDPRLPKALEERKRTGKFKGEINFIRKDGAIFPCEVSSNIFKDPHGNERTSMIIRDLTEDKKAERVKQESEQVFSIIFKNNPNAISLVRASDGKNVDVNDVWCTLTGYTREEAIGRTTEELKIFTPEQRKMLIEEFQKHGFSKLVESELTAKNGKKKNVLISSEPITINNERFVITNVIEITERKRAEEALRESETKLRAMLNTMSEGIALNEIIYDENGEMVDYRILEVNKAFYNIANYTEVEVVGSLATKLYGMSSEVIRDFWRAHKGRDQVQHTEMLSPLSNRSFYISTSPFVGNKFVTAFFDITERKRTEEALRESGEKFRAVFESANVGKSITLPTGELSVNKAFCDMLGYTPEELKNKKWQELTPPEEIESIQKEIEPLLSGQKDSTRFNKRYIRKDGGFVWADVSVAMQRDEKGKPLYFITTVVDITEQKQAKEQLRLSQERFFNAFHISPVGLTITRSSDGKFIDVNNAFLTMFEFTRDEVIGRTSVELNILSHEVRKELIQRQLATGGVRNAELQVQSKSGRKIHILFSSKPMKIEGEACYITTLIDITDRKHAETQVQKQLEELRRWQKIMLEQSDRSQQLKREVNELLQKLGEPIRYPSQMEIKSIKKQ